jgi:hypothetical protein
VPHLTVCIYVFCEQVDTQVCLPRCPALMVVTPYQGCCAHRTGLNTFPKHLDGRMNVIRAQRSIADLGTGNENAKRRRVVCR